MFSQSRLDLFTALNVLADELKQVLAAGPDKPDANIPLQVLEYAITQAHARLRRGWKDVGPESAVEHIKNALAVLEAHQEQANTTGWDEACRFTPAEIEALRSRLLAALEGLAQ